MSLSVANTGLQIVPQAISAARQRVQLQSQITAQAISEHGQQVQQANQRTISAAQTQNFSLQVRVSV
jgi:hypothetical protein